jgi:hypothetical protein
VSNPYTRTILIPAIGGDKRVILPSTLNVIIIGFSVIIFGFIWRMMAAKMSDSPWGQAMAVIW